MEDDGKEGEGDDASPPPPPTTTPPPPLSPLHAVDAALRSVAARVLAGEAAAWAVGAGGAGRWAARVARAPARALASGVRLEAWRGVAVAVAPPGSAPPPSAGGAAIAVEVGADADGSPAAVALPDVCTPRADARHSTPLALAPSHPDPELLLLRTAAAAAARHLDAVAAALGGEARFCALGGVARVQGGTAARAALTAPPSPPPAPPRLHLWVGGSERAPPLATLALALHSGAHALATTTAHRSGNESNDATTLPAPAPHLDAAARRAADADAAAGDRGGAAAVGVARALAVVVERAASAAAVAAAAHAAAARGLPAASAPAPLLAAALHAAGIADADHGGGADRVLVLALAPPPPLPAGVAAADADAGARAPRAFLLALPPRPDDPPGGDWKHALALAACDAHGVPTRLLSAAAVGGGHHTAAPPPTPRAKKRAREGETEADGGGSAAAAAARDAAGWGPSRVAALAAAAAAAAAAAPWDAARHQLAAAGATLVDECTPGLPGGAPRVVVAGLPSLAALEARCRGVGGGDDEPPPPPRVELRPAARGAAWHLVIRSAYFAGLPATAGAAVVAEPAPSDARRAAAAAAAVRHDDDATHAPSPPIGVALEYRPGDGDSPALALSDAVRCLRLHTLLARCAEVCGGGGRSHPHPFSWTVPGIGTVRLAAASAARALLVVVPPAEGGGGRRPRGRGAAAPDDASLFSSPPPPPRLAPDTASAAAQTALSPPVGVLLPSRADRGAALSRIRIEWDGDARAPPRARVAADPPLPAGAATALADAAEAGAEGAFLDGLAFAAFAAAAAADVGAAGAGGVSTPRVALSLAALPATYDVAAASAPGRPPLRARAVVAAGGVTWVGGGGPRVASALGGDDAGGVWMSGRGELSAAIAKLAAAAAKG